LGNGIWIQHCFSGALSYEKVALISMFNDLLFT